MIFVGISMSLDRLFTTSSQQRRGNQNSFRLEKKFGNKYLSMYSRLDLESVEPANFSSILVKDGLSSNRKKPLL